MAEYEINIYHLFPDLLNLYADKGNIAVITKRCAWRGIKVNYKGLYEGETPDFSDVDIVLLGGGSNREQLIVSRYASTVAGPLKEYIESNGVCLAVCAGYQLLGNFYEADGQVIPCFGILDIDTVSGEGRLIGNLAIEATLGGKTIRMAGFENHGGRTNTKNHTPLGKVISGYGNDGKGDYEGVLYKNTVATYLHGPILPKNPELADYLIETALRKKYQDFADFKGLDNSMEVKAKEFIIERELKKQSK